MSTARRHLGQRDEGVEELRKAVYILAEQVGRFMAERQMKEAEEKSKPSISQRFVDEVALVGVVDAIKAKSTILKAFWTFVFVVTFSTTAYLVYKVIHEYRQNPTATKVEVLRNATYEFPSIVLCLDTWFSLQKAGQFGFTRSAVQYALNYLVRYDDTMRRSYNAQCRNWEDGEREFLEAYHSSNISSLLHFYRLIALDAVRGDQFDPTAVTFQCSGCAGNTSTLKKVVVDRGVCYEVPLQTDTGKLRGADGLWRLAVQAPNLTDGLVDVKPYWRLYINTQLTQIQPTSVYLSIDKTTSTAITIYEQRFRMVDTVDEPCVQRAQSPSAIKCPTKCLAEIARINLGCRLLSLETDTFLRPPTGYCNRCSWKQISQKSQEEEQSVQSCLDACPHECETWMYDGTVDKHWSSSTAAKLQTINSKSEVKFASAKIFFKNGAVLRGGILTFTEVFTYSLETLIGTVGGTCGIWISVGVLTIIQLIIFLVQVILARGVEISKAIIRRKSVDVPMSEVHPAPAGSPIQSGRT